MTNLQKDHVARMRLTNLSDEALALAAREGDARALEVIVDRYGGRLIAYLRRRTRSAADAEDLAQETLVRAWVNLDSFDANRSFRAWLFTIASRLAVDLLRKDARRSSRELTHSRQSTTAHDEPDAALGMREQSSRLWRLADQTLTDNQRAALWLRYAENLSIAQISQALGKSNVGVRVALHRARATLRGRCTREDASHGRMAILDKNHIQPETPSAPAKRSAPCTALEISLEAQL